MVDSDSRNKPTPPQSVEMVGRCAIFNLPSFDVVGDALIRGDVRTRNAGVAEEWVNMYEVQITWHIVSAQQGFLYA